MITIEASHIYFRGGFVLLEQIVEYCEQEELEVQVYLGYVEVFDYLSQKKYKYIRLVQTNGIYTLLRYMKKRIQVLFFCNLPPFVKSKKSVLYAHNILFFESPEPIKGVSRLFNLKKLVYFYWIKLFARNVDAVACQTEAVKQSLLENMQVEAELYPFYKVQEPLKMERKYAFCYVGSGASHKNNLRLLEAVEELSEKYVFTLQMTIEKSDINKELIGRIESINQKYGREVIVNWGFVPNHQVADIYASSVAMIFPSQAETIALPLIEGLQHGLKILSSDLAFTHQVVENPIVFNPVSVEEIKTTMESQLLGKYDKIVQNNKIPNKLPELIQCLRP